MAILTPDSETILQTFIDMVKIDSPSGGEEEMTAWLKHQVDVLGLASRVDTGGNLIVEVPKNKCNHDSILVFSGHMDVVPPCHGIKPSVSGEAGDRLVVSDNTTVLGADDKAALAPILEAIRLSLQQDLPRPKTRLIFTTREETFLGGAKDLDDKALDADFAVTFDHTGRQGTIIERAPSYVEFNIECRGKSVHAGIMPERGVNAIVFGSKVIERMNLGRINEETTANIGFIKGGKGTNVVPDLVTIRGELRSHDELMLSQQLASIQKILDEEKAKMPGVDYVLKQHHEFHRYEIDPASTGVRRVMESAERVEIEPKLTKTNGGSDNNVFMSRGLQGIVMGASFMEPHSLRERVLVSEMARCGSFVSNLLECFAREPF